MAQRRFHYDLAFEHYLRQRKIAYIAVDEAKRAITAPSGTLPQGTLKSFDFVVYSQSGPNLLVDVKGRKHSGKSTRSLDNWVTQGDVDCMKRWQEIFGSGFEAAFVFLYWCEAQPPDALFHEIFELGGKWYSILAIRLSDYAAHLRPRSPKWNTVGIPADAFRQLTRPLHQML